MTCGHENCSTPFCPSCGQAVKASPLTSLTAFIGGGLSRAETGLVKAVANGSTQYGIDARRRSVEKWSSWLKLLERLNESHPC